MHRASSLEFLEKGRGVSCSPTLLEEENFKLEINSSMLLPADLCQGSQEKKKNSFLFKMKHGVL